MMEKVSKEQYARFALHVTERGKSSCTDCDGRGSLWLTPHDENDNRSKPCPRCAGQAHLPVWSLTSR